MVNIKIFVFLLTLHLAASLKPNDFCIRKQQECKGFYDRKHNYHTKCELIKCNGVSRNHCGFNICSKNKNKCIDYIYVYSNLALVTPLAIEFLFTLKDFEKKKNFNRLINKYLIVRMKFINLNQKISVQMEVIVL